MGLSRLPFVFLSKDAALLEQVTSRAHRLGATGPVTVETVNTLYKLDPDMQKAIDEYQKARTIVRGQDDAVQKSNNLTTQRCEYCYRQFDSRTLALEHERSTCPRNPANLDVVDRFHLSSVYREIRPPPPLVTQQ